jgi:S-disulfanyl-L-cysteine oxidoreductase SoxD
MSMPEWLRVARGRVATARRVSVCAWVCVWASTWGLAGCAQGPAAADQAQAYTPRIGAMQALPAGPRLGQPVSHADAARGQWNVFPDGRGLPPGQGTALQGEPLFRTRCAVCHGDRGRGGSAEELAGGSEPLTSRYPDKTIGLYWPYATTLFDVIRRSMPMFAPGSLDANAVYALTAYLLAEEGLIGERDEMNAATLPRVHMPNRDGFVTIDAPARR